MFFDDDYHHDCHCHFWEDMLMLYGVGVIVDRIMDGNKKPQKKNVTSRNNGDRNIPIMKEEPVKEHKVIKDYTPKPEQMEKTKDFLSWINSKSKDPFTAFAKWYCKIIVGFAAIGSKIGGRIENCFKPKV